MSGGIDSSVSVSICLEKGYDVTGVTLKMTPDKKESDPSLLSAVNTAQILGIQHKIIDVSDIFKNSVLKYAWSEYLKGRTPNPCAVCNKTIKFGWLVQYAIKNGAIAVATGHYAIIDSDKNKNLFLRRGIDNSKDQSYFLFNISPKYLDKIIFPLGSMRKDEVRKIASKLNLPASNLPESSDLCFIQDGGTYASHLKSIFKKRGKKGFFIDTKGNKIGKHDGIHNFTIGQRKGLGIALGKPAFIKHISAKTGYIVISTEENDLMSDKLTVSNLNWQIAKFAKKPFKCLVQIRYRHCPAPAKVTPIGRDKALIEFDNQVRAVTPGQAAVFYKEDIVIGGGWID